MTMPVIDAVTLEQSGIQIQEVVPGSADDPFVDPSRVVSPPTNASPAAAVNGGTANGEPGDGSKSQTPSPAATPASPAQPPAQPAQAPNPATPAAGSKNPADLVKELNLDDYIAGLVGEKVSMALRSQQSSYDKRINALQEELKAAREASLKAEREAKLEGLSDEEREYLQNKWALDDREQALREYEQELDNYWRSIYVAKLVEENAQFGVTAEELEAFTEESEIEAYIKDKQLEYYRSGRHLETQQIPTRAVEPTGTASASIQVQQVPAGAVAPTDVGGNAPAAPAPKLEQGTGFDVMARNLSKLQWESIPFN